MRLVPLQCVKENSILARDIYDDQGRVLLREGTLLTEGRLKRIKDLHIFTVHITDEYSDEIIDEIIKPEVRQKAILIVKEKFYNLERSISGFNVSYNESEKEYESIAYMAKQLIEEILLKRDVVIDLVDIKSFDNYVFQHCINVAVISLVIGIKLNLHKFDLIDLCIGAMLHDIGKVFIPMEILNKKGKLTNEEFEIMKQHTIKGYGYLKESSSLSITSMLVALQHHEKVCGQGYPYGKSREEISKFAKIVAIADVYDALTSDRPYRQALSPNEALEYIMANGEIQFEYKYVQVFTKVVVPYYIGTLVKLSDGDIAVVRRINFDVPLRPQVEIIKSDNKKNIGKLIDLVKEIGIVIEGVQYQV